MTDLGEALSPAPVVADPERLRRFVTVAFEAAGASRADARAVAEGLVRTDLRGVHTHGVQGLPIHVRNLRDGGTRSPVEPEVVRETPVTAVIDGHDGIGHVVAGKAMRYAIDKARKGGIGIVLVRRSNHLGAVGHYALEAAEAGFVGLSTSNASRIMTAAGSRGKAISNAPFAYGVPMPDFPMVFDAAMSATAGFKVRLAAERGDRLREGLVVDAAGRPTTDPSAYLEGGALLPAAGHKGYGLALLTESLAGVLSGAGITSQIVPWLRDTGTPTNAGHAFMVFDVECFMDRDEFASRMQHLVDELHALEPAPGVERVLVPGELEHVREQRARAEGLVLEPVIWSHLEETAQELDLSESLAAVPVTSTEAMSSVDPIARGAQP